MGAGDRGFDSPVLATPELTPAPVTAFAPTTTTSIDASATPSPAAPSPTIQSPVAESPAAQPAEAQTLAAAGARLPPTVESAPRTGGPGPARPGPAKLLPPSRPTRNDDGGERDDLTGAPVDAPGEAAGLDPDGLATVGRGSGDLVEPPEQLDIERRAARFRPATQDDLAPSGAVTRVRANIEALRALRVIEQQQRPALAVEQTVLARRRRATALRRRSRRGSPRPGHPTRSG